MTKISRTHHKTKNGKIKKNPTKKNLYLDYKRKVEKDIEEFPMAFAFSDKQLKEGLDKLGVSSKSEVISIGYGGFIRKSDKQKFIEMNERHENKKKELMKNEKFVYQMFRYELANHEYVIRRDYTDTLDALGLTMDDINNNPMWKKQLIKARDDYLKKLLE